MARSEKYLAIIIFLIMISAFAGVSGYQYVGDFIEKALNAIGIFANYFVLIALFSIYKGVALLSRKQLLFLAYFIVLMTLATYLYPYFKYSEQEPTDLMSTFFYDLIFNIFVFTLLIKEASREQ